MTSNSAMIGELSTSQKLDGTNYETWHWKIQYFLDNKDLLEHLKAAKVPPSDKHRDGKPTDTTTMQYRNQLRHTKTGPIRIVRHALLCCIACMTTSLGSLRHVPLLKIHGIGLGSGSAKHLLPGFVPYIEVDTVRDGFPSYYSWTLTNHKCDCSWP